MAAALGSMVPEGYALAEASADNINAVQEPRSRDADEEEQRSGSTEAEQVSRE